jgi:aspartyl-tRNA(Asn)/glutamyl-tRNA(Gln) amidotransferase subunit C
VSLGADPSNGQGDASRVAARGDGCPIAVYWPPMARVTVETVDHVARLARLSLTGEERETFARQLEEILSHAESIQSLDTTDVPPMSHAARREDFRPDVPREGLDRERVLSSAPDPAEGLFRVPKVIGG